MNSEARTLGYVQDMLEHAQYVTEFIQGLDYGAFVADRARQFAVVRALEIIGEAAKSIRQPVRDMAPGIPWRQITAMRDKLIHHYFGVDVEIVWESAAQDVPALKRELEVLISVLENKTP